MTTSALARLGTALALAAFLSAACGGDGDEEAVDTSVPPAGGDAADYEPARGPAELAVRSELVVRGRIADVVRGRSFGEERSEVFTEMTVVRVDVTEVLKGELPADAGGRVYVERWGSDTTRYPAGAAVLLYLVPRSERSLFPGAEVNDPGAGRPSGQPLFAAVTPQGFFVAGDDSVGQPQEGLEFPDSTFEDFEPDKSSFPASTTRR